MTAARSTPGPFRFSREQYYKLGELGFFDGKRVERIRGEIIEMSPINWPHVVGCHRTSDVLRAVFAGAAWINMGNPIPTTDSDPQPDVMVVPGRLEDYTNHPTAALLIMEVSDATLDRDLTIKAELYAEAGVPEYWVLDVNARRLHVMRDPFPLAPGGHAYRTLQILSSDDSVSPLAAPAAVLAVAALLP